MSDQKQDSLSLFQKDPRFNKIKRELEEQFLKKPGNKRFSAEHIEFLQGRQGADGLDSQGRVVDLNYRAEQEFRTRHPEDAKTYDLQEETRVYSRPHLDPAIKSLEKDILHDTNNDPEVEALPKNGNLNSYRASWNKVHARQRARAWRRFAERYPDKAKAYAEAGHMEIKTALETQTKTQVKQVPPSGNAPTPPGVINIFFGGIQELKNNPTAPKIAGIPRQSFTTILSNFCGIDILSSRDSLTKAQNILQGVKSTTPAIESFSVIYDRLYQHSHDVESKMPRGLPGALRPEQQQAVKNYLPQQVAFATVASSLPAEHLTNTAFITHLGDEFLGHDFTADDNTTKSTSEKIQRAANKAELNLSETHTLDLTQKTVAAVNRLKGIGKAQNLGMSMAALGMTIGSALGRSEDDADVSETLTSEDEETNQEPSTSQSLGTALAFGIKFGISKGIKKITGTFFKRAIDVGLTVLTGGLSKGAQIALKTVGSFFRFLGGRLGNRQPGEEDTLSILLSWKFILFVILSPFIIIFCLTIFTSSVVRPTALIDEFNGYQGSSLAVGGDPGNPNPYDPISDTTEPPAEVPTATPTRSQTVPPTGDTELPEGFPISSSCVTQLPNGSASHKRLNSNAVDISPRSEAENYKVKATHRGVVNEVKYYSDYGNLIIIESPDKSFYSYYAHLRTGSTAVSVGEVVERGTYLALVDTTGNSTGDHLHYELRGTARSKTGTYGTNGAILDFLPSCSTWSCSTCNNQTI